MGLEDHRIALVCTLAPAAVTALLRESFGLTVDELTSETTTYLTFEDASHIIECEVYAGDACTQLALRFALCQPRSIDPVFERLVTQIIDELGAVVSGDPAEPPALRLRANFESIHSERAAWRRVFGTETARVTCLGAIERFIAPSWGAF